MACVLLGASLTGCTPDQAQTVLVKCGTVAGLSKGQQTQIAAEMRKLPPGSIIADVVIPDWIRGRDEVRACAQRALSS